MNKKEEGISIIDLMKLMFISWKRLLIMMAIFAAVLVLGLHFGYTANSRIYTIEFSYNDDNLKSGHYEDGTKFNYIDIISETNIKNVVDGNSEFSKLDYKKMLEKNGIEILRQTTNLEEIEATKAEPEYLYIISIKASNFGLVKTKDKALSFLTKLITTPINNEKTIVASKSFDNYLTQASSVSSYKDKINYLALQYEKNVEDASELISLFGDFRIYEDGKALRLSEETAKANSYFNDNSLEALASVAAKYGYTETKSFNHYLNKKNSLVSIIEETNATIESLENKRDEYITSGGTTSESFNERIATLVEENQANINELTEVERYLYNISLVNETSYTISAYVKEADVKRFADKASYVASYDAFIEDVNEAYNTLNNYSKSISKFSVYAYNNYSTITYQYPSVMVQSGGFNIVVTIIISIVLSFFIAGFINIIVDRKHLNDLSKTKKEGE